MAPVLGQQVVGPGREGQGNEVVIVGFSLISAMPIASATKSERSLIHMTYSTTSE